MAVSFTLALLLAVVVGAQDLQPDPRQAQADDEFAARQYNSAALTYEDLYADSEDPAVLRAAARSRRAAGHHAHAAAYLRQLLASGRLTAAQTQAVYAELQAVQRDVTPVTVRVELPAELPAEQAGAVVILTAEPISLGGTAVDPSPTRPPLAFPLGPGASATRTVILQLDPGTWRIHIEDPTLTAAEAIVEVHVQPGPAVHLALASRQVSRFGLPHTQQVRTAAVLGTLGGGMAVAGAGITSHRELGTVAPVLRQPADTCDGTTCRDELARGLLGRSLGTSLLGAGVGVLAGGLTMLVRDPRVRRRMWIAELAIGGAGVVGGSLALALSTRGFDRENADPDHTWGDPKDMDTLRLRATQHTLAATGLGLGSGLVFGAAAGLLRTRIYNQRYDVQPSIAWQPNNVTVAVSGRF